MKIWESLYRPDPFIIQCAVGCDEYLLFELMDDDDPVAYMAVIDAYRPRTLWRRVKAAWQLITIGHFTRSSVDLVPDDLDKIISWCQNVRASFKEVKE